MREARKKHNFLTIKQKIEILEKLEKGQSAASLAEKYSVAKSTISMIKGQSSKILEFVKNADAVPKKRKTLKLSELPKMEDALYSWVCNQRQRHAVVSTSLLCQKALELNNLYRESEGFTASKGWAEKFRKRRGIRFLKVTGEKLSNNPDLVEPFLNKLHSTIRRFSLTPEQVYNADETGLFWKLLPDKTLVLANEKSAPGRKSSKERLTFLACTNATGTHKIKPLVIGKSQNPRAFKGFNLPVHYEASANAWMTQQIFFNWFKKAFIPEVKKFLEQNNLPKKVLLLLDNAPCHPPADELASVSGGLVAVMFFPPNVTALLQPMDQNVINLVKIYYKKNLLTEIISSSETDIQKAIKMLTLRHAINFLSLAWEKLSPTSIEKCWKIIIPKEYYWDSEDDIPLSTLQRMLKEASVNPQESTNNFTYDVHDLRNMLELLPGALEISDADIEAWVQDNPSEYESETENLEEVPEMQQERTQVSHAEAIKCVNILLDWANENHLDINSVNTLCHIREKVLKTLIDSRQQAKITNYFPRV